MVIRQVGKENADSLNKPTHPPFSTHPQPDGLYAYLTIGRGLVGRFKVGLFQVYAGDMTENMDKVMVESSLNAVLCVILVL